MITGSPDPSVPPTGTVTWSIVRFNRICYVSALLWIGAALFISFRIAPTEIGGHEYHDFSQFYMGGVIARHAAWNGLYPIPHAGSVNSPGEWEHSEVRAEYKKLADEAGVPEKSSRFIQPPPFALMMEPIAYLKYRAAKRVWNLLMVLCGWGVAVMAGRSYELAARRKSAMAGTITVFVAVSPLMLETLRLMNVTPLIALLIGLATLSLLCKYSEAGAVALVLGAAAKYATASLVPMYVAMRKWRAVVVMGITTIAILGACYAVMKSGPFAVFFKEMMPTLGRTHTDPWNRSFSALLMRLAARGGGEMKPLTGMWFIASQMAQWGSLLGILAILFTRKVEFWRDPAHVLAGATALVAWFLMFSPILWDHYFLYLVPTWGWLIWEARRSLFKGLVVGGVILYHCLPEYVLDFQLPRRLSLNRAGMTLEGPYGCFMLLTAAAIVLLAIARLLMSITRPEEDPRERRTTFSFTREQFNRCCTMAAALWLLLATPLSLHRWSQGEGDFPQFYMGGVMARLHAWDSLYPIPNPGSHNNAGMEGDSTMRPRYAEEAAKRDVGDRQRFIQPPPVALLLMPLGYLHYNRAFELWTLMLVGCGLGVALLAGKVYEILNGEKTKISGGITLLVACSPLMLHAIRVANMTVPVALVTGIAVVELVRRREAISSAAIVLGAVTKYTTIALLPLVLVMRRWKLLGWSVLFSAILFGGSFAVMKSEPFQIYRHEIAPTLARTHDISTNQSISGFVTRLMHRDVLPRGVTVGILVVQGITLMLLLWLLLRKPVTDWQRPGQVFAAAMALLSFLLIFSPVFWEHYPVYLCPLWGWLVWEARRCWGTAVLAVIAIALTYVPWTAWMDLREPWNTHILPSAVIMFGVGVWKMVGSGQRSPDAPAGAS